MLISGGLREGLAAIHLYISTLFYTMLHRIDQVAEKRSVIASSYTRKYTNRARRFPHSSYQRLLRFGVVKRKL
jgi:hypothetical protein